MISMKNPSALLQLLLATGVLVAGCKVGPNYSRPAVNVPGQYYNGVAPDLSNQAAQPAQASGSPFGETKWEDVFQDDTLRGLIDEALKNNYDIKIAAARITEAQANVGIVRANQLPSVTGFGGVDYYRNALQLNGPTVDSVGLQVNYIVDFWGKYRRMTEAARAQLLATKFAKDVVQTTLISTVASNYYAMREYDSQLSYSQQTLAADQDILKLNTVKFNGGDASLSDVYQAQILVEEAQAQIIASKQAMAQSENQISILLGRNPGPVTRGLALDVQPHLAEIPTGLPSALLERRPDVRQTEANLIAANANVGVAKANFFPQLALTGQFGAASTAITSFLQGPATVWSVAAQVTQPLYAGGAITNTYRLAWAQRDEAEQTYKKTILGAFGDVANTLVGYNQSRQYRIKIEEQTKTYKDTSDLAVIRFNNGYASFIEVLVTEQQYFDSELLLASAWNTELTYYVQLYQALGGGWTP